MKRLFLLFFGLLMVSSFLSAQTSTIDGVNYKVTSTMDKTATVSGQEIKQSRELVIPAVVKINSVDYTVTAIDGGVFNECSYLTAISIPSSIKTIGNKAFAGCGNVSRLYFDAVNCTLNYTSSQASFLNLGSEAGSLKIIIGRDVVTMPTFRYTKVTALEFEKESKCEEIANTAFLDTPLSGDVILPASIKTIGSSAFRGTKIETAYVGPAVTKIDRYAFYNITTLRNFILDTPAEFNGSYEILKDSGAEGNFTFTVGKNTLSVPNLVNTNVTKLVFEAGSKCETIVNNAFKNKGLVGELILPESIKTIGEYAFFGTKVNRIVLPASVTEVGASAFYQIDSLSKLELNCTPNYGSTRYAFAPTSNSTRTFDLIIGKDVTEIADALFSMAGLKSVTIEPGGKLVRIGRDAFSGNPSLSGDMTIPTTVKEIGDLAFANTGITTAHVGAHVEKFGANVFADCLNLEKLYYDVPNCANTVIGSVNGNKEEACMTEITIGPNVKTIPTYFISTGIERAFHVIFSEATSLEVIEDYAFMSLPNVTFDNLYFPSTLKKIGKQAFYSCNSANVDLRIPASVESIGYYAFAYMGKATSLSYGIDLQKADIDKLKIEGPVNIEKGVKAVRQDLFAASSDRIITGLSFDDDCDVEVIEGAAFAKTSLTGNLVLPETVRIIGDGAFGNCSGLRGDLIIPATVDSIGASAFNGCGFDGRIELPSGLTRINDNTFANCGFIGELTLPGNIEFIGKNAFLNCAGLTGHLLLPATLKKVDWDAFAGTSFTELTIEDSNDAIEFGNNFVKNGGWVVHSVDGELLEPKVDSMSGVTLPDGQFAKMNLKKAYIGRDMDYLRGAIMDMGISRYYYSPFNGIKSLENVTMGVNISEAKEYMFAGNDCLRVFELKHTTPPTVAATTFSGSDISNCTLVVPKGCVNAYQSTQVWQDFLITDDYDASVTDVMDDEGVDCKYYDLQGRPVKKENLKAGLYISVSSNRKDKVIID